jgi:protein required for attachment to host cells
MSGNAFERRQGARLESPRNSIRNHCGEERLMTELKIEAGDWVVVCDGRKALILANEGDAKFPNLRTHETHEHDDARTRDQGADRPGRVHESATTGRSAVQQTDWHDQAETEFLQKLAHRLGEAIAKDETRSLTLVAAPRALGVLRQAMSPAVHAAVTAEIDKDYVNMPVYEIEKRLTHSG